MIFLAHDCPDHDERGHSGWTCYTCHEVLCAREFDESGGHRLKSCWRCRWVPECDECGIDGRNLIRLIRGRVVNPLDRDEYEHWTCRPCVDRRLEIERQARLAEQRAKRKASPPEPGRGWARSAARRIAEYGLDSEVHEFTRAEVVERQGSESCVICEATDDLTLDHVHPLAAGGPHTLENVRLLCAPCNGWKVAEIDRPLIEAARAKVRRAELSVAA